MRNTFTFGSITSSDFGVYISGSGVYNAPEREYNPIPIPGRNGDILLDGKRYSNIEVTYPAFIYSNYKTNLANLRSALLSATGYQRLSDTYHTDEYRLAYFGGGIEVDARPQNDAGEFELTFSCKPQRFLTSGDTQVTLSTSGTLTNPTLFNAKPLIVCTGAGTLTIKSQTITIASGLSPITIDCENMDCYSGTTNANSYVTFSTDDFPVLEPGANAYSRTGFSSVKVTPRWWRL